MIERNEGPEVGTERQRTLSFFQIISVKRCAFGLFWQLMNSVCLTFTFPLLSNYIDKNRFKPEFMGAAMAMTSVFFIIGNILVLTVFNRIMSKRATIFFGFSLQMLAVFIIGSKEFLGIERMAYLILVGLVFLGTGLAMICVPIMPEIIEGITSSSFKSGSLNLDTLHNHISGYFITG